MRTTVRFLLCVTLLGAVAAARAGDLKLEATLVWGANDENPPKDCKPVDPKLAAGLHGIYKWKNYYEITNKTASIPLDQSRDLKMSDHCTLRIKNIGGSRVETECIGEGKPVHKRTDTLKPPNWLVLGGNADNNTAWFIGLRSNDGKAADANKAIGKN